MTSQNDQKGLLSVLCEQDNSHITSPALRAVRNNTCGKVLEDFLKQNNLKYRVINEGNDVIIKEKRDEWNRFICQAYDKEGL